MFMFNTLCFFLFVVGNYCFVDYSNHSLFNILIRSKNDLEIYKSLSKVFEANELDYWFQGKSSGEKISIFASPNVTLKLKSYLEKQNHDFNVISKNWNEPYFKKETKSIRILKRDFQHNIFHSYDEIVNFLKLQAKKNKDFVSVKMYGETFEKRLLYNVKIGYSNGKDKPMVIIDSGIHAREWITHASTLIITNYLISNVEKYKKILEEIDIIIFPVLNPDGYVHSRTEDRMWRGNRNLIKNKDCGVDLNRNYPFKWSDYGWICNSYPGTHELSEFESMYHSFYLKKYQNYIKGYISFHNYGRFILFPWTYTKEYKAKDYHEMIVLGKKMKKTIEHKTNVSYKVGPASKILYEAFGTSLDYIKSLGIKYVYVIELSPSVEGPLNGFVVEENEITTIAKEAFIAFEEMLYQVYSEL